MRNELGVILMVVLFAILSITFGVFWYMNSNDLAGGDKPENRPDARILVKKKAIEDLETKITEYQDRKVKLNEEISKQTRQAEYYRSEIAEYRKAIEKRFQDKQGGIAFKKQVEDNAAAQSVVKSKTLQKLEADITSARTEMDKRVTESTERKTKVQADVLAAKTIFEGGVKTHRAEMNYEKSQLGDTKSVLQDLTTREPIHAKILDRADGQVVLSDIIHNFVTINIGTGVGVKNGMRFEVYAIAAGNKHVTRAYIEVRNAGETQSECLVIQRPIILPEDKLSGYLAKEPEEKYNPLAQSGKKGASAEPFVGGRTVMTGQSVENPIIEGDLVQNPFFDAGHPRTFYIAGSKEVVGDRQKSAIRYRWTEIRDAAVRHGSKVVTAIDTNVDFVIAQKNPQDDPEFKKAVDLGIPVIYEWELFRFLDND